MKKFFCAVLAVAVPALMLAGCGTESALLRTDTSKSAPDFFTQATQKLISLKDNLEIKMSAPNSTSNAFDFSSFTSDAEAEAVWDTKVWQPLQKANTENLVALLAYDIYEKNQNFNFYDLSFLSQTSSDTLKNFSLKKISEDQNSKRVYQSYLTGLEDTSLNLPVPVAVSNNQDVIDEADEIIKQWGNALNFTVQKKQTLTEVEIEPAFIVPTPEQVQATVNNNSISADLQALPSTNGFVLVYTLSDGLTYSKKVTFEATLADGMKKKVEKFLGDLIQNPNLIGGISYEYELKTNSAQNIDIACDYTIGFDASKSGIFCQQKRQGNTYVWTEYAIAQSGELVGRLKTSQAGKRTTIDTFVNRDLSTGAVKYNYQTKNELPSKYLRDESILKSTFCTLTPEEINLAKNSKPIETRIVNFTISHTNFSVAWAHKS